MKQLFAVMGGRGPAWNGAAPLEMQSGWSVHVAFMNGLAAEGLIGSGGPLGGNGDTLLVFRAESESDIRAAHAADSRDEDMLPLLRVAQWQLRLSEHHLD